MLPLRLTLEGFRSFNELELDLPAGCVSLSGANGAGKSSIVDAIDVALFGPDGRSFDPYLAKGAGELRVELGLEHAGDRYRVRRTFNGRHATLDLERETDDEFGFMSLTQGSAADTQAELERLLGITRETFRASALLKQGQGGTFTEASPKDRKRILAAALALGVWDEAALAVAADRREAGSLGDKMNGRLELLRERVEAAGDPDRDVDAFTAALAEAERIQAERAGTVADLEQRVADVERAEQNRRHAETELELATRAFDEHADKLETAEEAKAELEAVVAELVGLEGLVERLAAARTELSVAETAAAVRADRVRAWTVETQNRERLAELADRLEARRVELEGSEPAKCLACGQPLDAAAREAALANLERERLEISEAREAVELRLAEITVPAPVDNLDELRQRVAELSHAPATLELRRAHRADLEQRIAFDTPENRTTRNVLEAARTAKREALNALEVDTALGRTLRERLAEAKAAAVAAEAGTRTIAGQLAGARERAKALADDREAIGRGELAVDENRRRLGDLAILEQAFGRDGVPAWIVEQHALPAIELEANRILGTLGGHVSRVELRTERALKSGDVRSDALDIVCVTREGGRDYATFSGGERTRVNLSLRIALARLLAHRRDADVRMLAIDEPDGLDEQGMSALVDVLRDLVLRGEFTTTLLASHVPALRDAFDVTIEVDRTELGSRAVIA